MALSRIEYRARIRGEAWGRVWNHIKSTKGFWGFLGSAAGVALVRILADQLIGVSALIWVFSVLAGLAVAGSLILGDYLHQRRRVTYEAYNKLERDLETALDAERRERRDRLGAAIAGCQYVASRRTVHAVLRSADYHAVRPYLDRTVVAAIESPFPNVSEALGSDPKVLLLQDLARVEREQGFIAPGDT